MDCRDCMCAYIFVENVEPELFDQYPGVLVIVIAIVCMGVADILVLRVANDFC